MEVRPGYKPTEVGVIPKDWDVRPLKEISPAQSVGLVVNPSSYFDERGTVPMLLGSNITANHIHWESAQRITETSNKLVAASRLATGDLITVRVGEPGITAVVPPELDGCNCASVMIVRQHHTFDSHWLCYVMNSKIGLEQVKHVQYGTAQKQFNIGDAVNFLFPVPLLAEQEAIAEVLSDADAVIESQERLLAKKRQIKQGAMQDLLTGKKRLPSFGAAEWTRTELGELPSDWRVVPIGLITEVKTGPFGSSLHERDYVDHGTPIITVEHLGENSITHVNLPLVSEADRRRLNAYSLEQGDIVFSRVGSVDRNARVTNAESGWLFSGRLLRLRASSRVVDTRFLSYQFHSEPFKQRVRTVAVGQTMASLNTQILKGVLVTLPPVPEQGAIAAILSDMDVEISALDARLAKARQLKQGMMQELLTGRIRLV